MLGEAPTVPKLIEPSEQSVVLSQYRAALATSDGLALLEAEGADVTKCASACPSPLGAGRVSAVLDNGEAVAACEIEDGIHVSQVAAEVYGDDSRRTRSDCGLGRLRVEAPRVGVNVHEDGDGIHIQSGGGGGLESEAGNDHLVPSADVQRLVGQLKSNGAVGDKKRVLGPAERGPCLVECRLHRPVIGPVAASGYRNRPFLFFFPNYGPGRRLKLRHRLASCQC